MTSRFTKLFYCEGANIAHIQSGVTLDLKTLAERRIRGALIETFTIVNNVVALALETIGMLNLS